MKKFDFIISTWYKIKQIHNFVKLNNIYIYIYFIVFIFMLILVKISEKKIKIFFKKIK